MCPLSAVITSAKIYFVVMVSLKFGGGLGTIHWLVSSAEWQKAADMADIHVNISEVENHLHRQIDLVQRQ